MRALGLIGGVLALCALAGCAALRPVVVYQEGKVEITRIDYGGWHGCWRMSNGTADLVLVPQIARIMQYGPADEDGLLFVNPALTPEATGGAEPTDTPTTAATSSGWPRRRRGDGRRTPNWTAARAASRCSRTARC